MRIHGNQLNAQAASLATAGNYRAENAERTTRTRKRLLKAAQTLDATTLETADPTASLLVGEWLNLRHNSALAEDEYTPGPSIGSADF